jgi:hypothetical protein
MVRAMVVCTAVMLCAAARAGAQEPARPDGWVVIPVDEYRALRLKAFPPERPIAPPPVDAALTRVDYELRVNGDSASGEARLTVDVLKEGWVRVDIPAGLLVRSARLDGRPVPLIDEPAPHVLLSKPGRAVVSLDVAIRLKLAGGSESLTLPPSAGAATRAAVVVPRPGIELSVSGGVLTDRAASPEASWTAIGRPAQSLTITWKKRVEDVRAAQPLKWRGSVTQIAALGEEASNLTATVRVDVVQGQTTSVDVAIPEGVAVNQVSGTLVGEWDFRPGTLTVGFLEPVTTQTSFAIIGELRVPRAGTIAIPLVRLPSAERESGGVAVEVIGAGEIGARDARGLDPADPTDLGEALTGRDSPSMVAFRFRPQAGSGPRSLSLDIARYTPQAVLIANVEEARYDALADEEGKTLVRARYAVRNNQRAFLAVTLPPGATLWSAAVAGRPLRPGVSPSGALLLALEKGRAGGDTPPFAVELTYVHRAAAWDRKGRATVPLPALDLPVARTGIVLRHSPRYRISAEPGTFRVETDTGPFTDALRGAVSFEGARPTPPPAPASPLPSAAAAPADERIVQFTKDTGGRVVTGPLPVRIPFPQFGPALFLTAELTAESQAPSVDFSYKRESSW